MPAADSHQRRRGRRPRPAPAHRRRGRAALADALRFLYVGQRARAESVVQQRQPGLIEALVRQQIHNTAWQEDIGRMLFQLMVPHDFKDAARQLERVVLVVDSCHRQPAVGADAGRRARRAGDDSLPMAVRTPVVRQLASTRFRARCARRSSAPRSSSAIRRSRASATRFPTRAGQTRKTTRPRCPAPRPRRARSPPCSAA